GLAPFCQEAGTGLPSLRRNGVVSAAGPAGLAAPVGSHEPTFLQPAEGGVQGGFFQIQFSAGQLGHGFVDFVAVAVPQHQPGQNDGVRMAADQISGNRHGTTSLFSTIVLEDTSPVKVYVSN